MPILKTNAIPLYFTNVSNTSRIITWLTAHYGKLSTIIKGDLRKNSLFRGQYDLFSTSELVFYDRTDKGIHITKECAMLHPRPVFRTDWKACAAAGYISALFAKTTLRHGHEPGRFAFFEEILSHAESYGHCAPFLVWFDLQFAEFMGQEIRLEVESQKSKVEGRKTEDGRRRTEKNNHQSALEAKRKDNFLKENNDPREWFIGNRQCPSLRFAADHGGLIEPGYASKHRIPATPIAPEAVALLKTWQKAPTPKSVVTTPYNPAHLTQIERILEKFVSWQFDLPPHVRKKAVETLRENRIRMDNRQF